MRRTLLVTLLTALALAVPAAAGLPRTGTLVPGRSLGGIWIGESQHFVRGALRTSYGRCNDCARPTWYFTYKPFTPQGLAVEFTGRRVSGVYTLWEPHGWHAANGLKLGATPLEVHERAGPLRTVRCRGYEALVSDTVGTRAVYYLYAGKLWGFGLFAAGAPPCR